LQKDNSGSIGGLITSDKIAAIHEPNVPDNRGTDLDGSAFLKHVERGIKREILLGLTQDRLERKTYAGKIFTLICCWLGGVFFLLIMAGFGRSFPPEFHFNVGSWGFEYKGNITFFIGDKVLMTIVGGTTATVLGLFVIVANYLFPKRINHHHDRHPSTKPEDLP
jgi:hypothetical protein